MIYLTNVAALQQLAKDIEQYGDRFDMKSWFYCEDGITAPSDPEPQWIERGNSNIPPCGTTACIAGFAVWRNIPKGSKIFDGRIYFPDGTDHSVMDLARDALELTSQQARVLFLSTDWNRDTVLAVLHHLIDHPYMAGTEIRSLGDDIHRHGL